MTWIRVDVSSPGRRFTGSRVASLSDPTNKPSTEAVRGGSGEESGPIVRIFSEGGVTFYLRFVY